MTKKISQSVLERIKKEAMQPRPRWQFVAINANKWTLAVLAIFGAGVFTGSFVADLFGGEWEIARSYPGGYLAFLHDTIPWLWLTGVMTLSVGAFFAFRSTRRGYRYGSLALTGFLVTAVIATAISLTPTRLIERVCDFREHKFPHELNLKRWHNPAEGFLIGEILEKKELIWLLRDFQARDWQVDVSQAKMPPFEFEVSQKIRVIGEIDGEIFYAEFVRPARPNFQRLKNLKEKIREKAKNKQFFHR